MRSVFKSIQSRNLMIVELTDQVTASTTISPENHPALRSGFVGFPPNPRWSTTKFCAWRTGCQWREALTKGRMIIRKGDSMLVPTVKPEVSSEDELPSSCSLQLSVVG